MNDKDYIYEVYKEKSFSNAAKNLFISQPALSASVKKVETQLGITIFDRSTSPIVLTDAGKVYIESIEKIMHIEDEMQNKLSDMSELKTGTIRISGENFVSSFIIPKIISEFTKKYPGIKIEITESNSPDLRQLLINDSIDLLIAHDFDKNLYEAVPLFDETLLLAVPESFKENENLKDYALYREDIINNRHLDSKVLKVDLKTFESTPFIMLKKGNDTRRRANMLFSEAGIEPNNTVINLDQLITSYNMACFGLGVAIVNDMLIKSSMQSGCVYYKISGRSAHRMMAIGYKKNRYCSKVMSAFIETAKEVYKDL